MKPTLILLLAVVFLSFNSCKKEKNNNNLVSVDSMIIQYNGGYAAEVIYHAYLIANGTVLEDTTSPFTQEHPNLFNKDLGRDTYQTIEELLHSVPEVLLTQNNARFTSNKLVDAGGATVKTYRDGIEYQCFFSEYTNDMPKPTKTFADHIFTAVHYHLKKE